MAYTGRKTGTKPYDVYDKADVDSKDALKQDKSTLKQDVEAQNIDAYTVQGVTKDLLGIGGDGYTWVDETSNRTDGTTYTNTYGKPIEVAINIGTDGSSGTFRVELSVDGKKVSCGSDDSTSYSPKVSARAIVPSGSTYSVDSATLAGTINGWFELK